MLSVKNVVKAINKEKRNERAKSLTLAAVLGAVAGAVTALFIAPKSEVINMSLNKLKENVFETIEKGMGKVDELVKEGKDKFEEGRDKLDAIRGDRSDIKDGKDGKDGKDNLLDTKEELKEELKG